MHQRIKKNKDSYKIKMDKATKKEPRLRII